MKLLVFVFLFVVTIAQAQSPSAKYVAFEISTAGWAESRGAYPVGKPISIRCTFRNNNSKPITLSLKDHDQYHGTLEYPLDIQARIESGDGKVLTVNEVNKPGWWTFFYLSSQISSSEPGDDITIPAGEKVTRVVPLDEVLKGCESLPHGLPAGHFVVQLRLICPELNIESNRIEIAVVPE